MNRQTMREEMERRLSKGHERVEAERAAEEQREQRALKPDPSLKPRRWNTAISRRGTPAPADDE